MAGRERGTKLPVAVLYVFDLASTGPRNLDAQRCKTSPVFGGSQQEVGKCQIDLRAIIKSLQTCERSEVSAGINAIGSGLMADPIRLHQVVDKSVQIQTGCKAKFRHPFSGVGIV